MGAYDVLIVGAGPAGAVAGLVLARAGARVRLIDRAAFPRDKLCGDTLNPGALALLRRLGVAGEIESRGRRVNGMLVTGERGVAVRAAYPEGAPGCTIARRELDAILLQRAIEAGCAFEPLTVVRRAIVDDRRGSPGVAGVIVGGRAAERVLRAPVTIAADGRRSTLAFGLGLTRHPAAPRRWAIGANVDGVSGMSDSGSDPEMHVRRGRYVGVAPLPGGLTNVCLVRPSRPGDPALRSPSAALAAAVAGDPWLRDRFAGARLAAPPQVLGPLAVDLGAAPPDGLLLAGDAAGFIDPMTGDGLRFAIRGAELAAEVALEALERGWQGVQARVAARRRAEFLGKQRFNRALRALVASPRALGMAAFGARLAPPLLRALVAHAGDCGVATAAGTNSGGGRVFVTAHLLDDAPDVPVLDAAPDGPSVRRGV